MASNYGFRQRSCLHCGKVFRFLLLERMFTEGVTHSGHAGCHRKGVTAETAKSLADEPALPDLELEAIWARLEKDEDGSEEAGEVRDGNA